MLSALALACLARATPMEPIVQAARSLGYAVVGEIKYSPRAIEPESAALDRELAAVREVCPRAPSDRALKKSHLVLLAWSDQEYPSVDKHAHAPHEVALATARAERLAERLRDRLGSALEFDLINMAERTPQTVRVLDGGRLNGPRYDAKAALTLTGAAPSTPLELGLFGEYTQRSKVVLWADCDDVFPSRPVSSRPTFALAGGPLVADLKN